MRNLTGWTVLCTTNDPESLTIVRIAQALHIPLVQSSQMHGAHLAQEPMLFERVSELAGITDLAIVEIPGPSEERALEERGIRVHIIDHHTYPNLDRMQSDASLTQFLQLFEITTEDLLRVGFDPEIVRGIAIIDQGFLWELAASNLSEEAKRATRKKYTELKAEIHPDQKEKEDDALRMWKEREMHGEFLVIRSTSKYHLREEYSFLIADAFPKNPPTSIIVEGDGRISVQETKKAEILFQKYGGFLFGKKECWGMLAKNNPPSVDKIIANLRE